MKLDADFRSNVEMLSLRRKSEGPNLPSQKAKTFWVQGRSEFQSLLLWEMHQAWGPGCTYNPSNVAVGSL